MQRARCMSPRNSLPTWTRQSRPESMQSGAAACSERIVSGGGAFRRSGFLVTWLGADVHAAGFLMPHLERARFLDKIPQLCVTVCARIEVRREIGKTPANQIEGHPAILII